MCKPSSLTLKNPQLKHRPGHNWISSKLGEFKRIIHMKIHKMYPLPQHRLGGTGEELGSALSQGVHSSK